MKRYDASINFDEDGEEYCNMIESSSGEWTEYADAAAEIAAKQARIAELEVVLVRFHDAVKSVTCDHDGVPCISGSDGDRSVLREAFDSVRVFIKKVNS